MNIKVTQKNRWIWLGALGVYAAGMTVWASRTATRTNGPVWMASTHAPAGPPQAGPILTPAPSAAVHRTLATGHRALLHPAVLGGAGRTPQTMRPDPFSARPPRPIFASAALPAARAAAPKPLFVRMRPVAPPMPAHRFMQPAQASIRTPRRAASPAPAWAVTGVLGSGSDQVAILRQGRRRRIVRRGDVVDGWFRVVALDRSQVILRHGAHAYSLILGDPETDAPTAASSPPMPSARPPVVAAEPPSPPVMPPTDRSLTP